jgi:hypothetical protein
MGAEVAPDATYLKRIDRVDDALEDLLGSNDGHPYVLPLDQRRVGLMLSTVEYLLVVIEDLTDALRGEASLDPAYSPQSRFDADQRAGMDDGIDGAYGTAIGQAKYPVDTL